MIRAEFAAIAAGFVKVGAYTGNANLPVFVNAGATAYAPVSAATARTNLGLVIGTNVQEYDATLTSIALLGTAADKIAYTTGVDTWAETALTSAARTVLDDTTVGAMVDTLGGASATGTGGLARSTSPTITTSIAAGGATFALLNTTATTINFGGAATALNMGAGAASTLTANFTTGIALNTAAITTNQTTLALVNTTATTVNFAGAASTALNVGNASGTNTILGATTFSQAITAASTINKVTITAPATSAALTISDGKTLAATATLTLSGTDSTVMTFPAASTTVAGLGTVQSFSVAQRGSETALTSSAASIAVNLALANNFSHTLTENTTLASPSNATAGQSGVITFTQHASSPKTLAYNSFWKFAGGVVPTLTASNSAVDVFTYYVHASGAFATCQLIKGVA